MDSKLHMDAAVVGNIEPFKEISRERLELMVTPSKNTILHINIMSGDRSSTIFVEDILNRCPSPSSTMFVEDVLNRCPSLLLQVNAKGETPLHVAAKCGKSKMVKILIKSAKARHEDVESGREAAKWMLRMIDNEGNTALHEAVLCQHFDVLKILTKEDPDFTYTFNNRGETPLYLAAAKASLEMVDEILRTCTSPAHEGPDQMTALHAAILCGDSVASEMTRKLLMKKESLIKEIDQNGWTPLHYAAYFCNPGVMKILLEYDILAAYMKDKYRKMTPLHLAVSRGYIPRRIISHFPDCCELVDERGWNFIHFAMLSLDGGDLITLLKDPLIRNLTNEKDVDGNTPLHLLAASRPNLFRAIVHVVEGLKADTKVVNKHNMSVCKVAESGSPPLKQEILKLEEAFGPYRDGVVMVAKQDEDPFDQDEKKKKEYDEFVQNAAEPHLIVATLIATVTFTAAFTLPGGVIQEGSHKGTAILSKRSAFQAFVITDAIAMIFSLSAVFAQFLFSLKTTRRYLFLHIYAFYSTLIAIGAMVIAFVTGTYAVLTTALWLAIVTCCIGLTVFIIFVFLFCKLIITYILELKEKIAFD